MTYLNDVPDGGTHFKYQDLTAPAEKGLTLMWPTDFSHTHKGQITQKHENLFEFTGNILSQLKDSRIRKIFSLRYSSAEKKPSWCIIAEKLQISTQTAINLHNKGISILRKKIKSEKFLDNV